MKETLIALRKWAHGKSEHVRGLVAILCCHVAQSKQHPHSSALREIVKADLARLEAARE